MIRKKKKKRIERNKIQSVRKKRIDCGRSCAKKKWVPSDG